jgi:hypothetical protein
MPPSANVKDYEKPRLLKVSAQGLGFSAEKQKPKVPKVQALKIGLKLLRIFQSEKFLNLPSCTHKVNPSQF